MDARHVGASGLAQLLVALVGQPGVRDARVARTRDALNQPGRDEAIDEPRRALEESLAARGVSREEFRVPGFGETILLPAPVAVDAEDAPRE